VDRDARADRDLLGSQSEIAGASDGVDFDEDVARIAEVNEMVAAIGT
jgi:predicted RNA-binding protein